MPAPENPFAAYLSGSKTYVTAASGIILNLLSAFHVFTPTAEQLTALNGAVILAAAVFLRMGVKKAEVAAKSAAPTPGSIVIPGPRGVE
jgi:hypothetical protein